MATAEDGESSGQNQENEAYKVLMAAVRYLEVDIRRAKRWRLGTTSSY